MTVLGLAVLVANSAVADDAAECLGLMDADSCLRAIVRDPQSRLVYLEARANTFLAQKDDAAAITVLDALLAEPGLAMAHPDVWQRATAAIAAARQRIERR